MGGGGGASSRYITNLTFGTEKEKFRTVDDDLMLLQDCLGSENDI